MRREQLTNVTTMLYGFRKRQQADKTTCGLKVIEAFCAQKDKHAQLHHHHHQSLYGMSGLTGHRGTY